MLNVSLAGDSGVEERMNASGLFPDQDCWRRLFAPERFYGIDGCGAIGGQECRENIASTSTSPDMPNTPMGI
jgi:hypothetical protein